MSAAAVPWSTVAWRQYRLERRMFWRNPSAAFFGVVLPLGLLLEELSVTRPSLEDVYLELTETYA